MKEYSKVEELVRQVNELDIKYRVVPIDCLAEIKSDIDEYGKTEDLNQFQKWILGQGYMLDTTSLKFNAKTILIAAIPLKLFKIELSFEGKKLHDLRGLNPYGLDKKLHEIWKQNGYILEHYYWLPQKRLAVRSGLAEYGRNNLVYADEYGSLCMLYCCLSDMPWDEPYTWRGIKNMDQCKDCLLCTEACPTGAIREDRFIIDNQICLTAINEQGDQELPEWIPKNANKSLVGCLECQKICPKNALFFEAASGTINYSEEETALLLTEAKLEKLPAELADKIIRCGLEYCYGSIARNLRAMLINANQC